MLLVTVLERLRHSGRMAPMVLGDMLDSCIVAGDPLMTKGSLVED